VIVDRNGQGYSSRGRPPDEERARGEGKTKPNPTIEALGDWKCFRGLARERRLVLCGATSQHRRKSSRRGKMPDKVKRCLSPRQGGAILVERRHGKGRASKKVTIPAGSRNKHSPGHLAPTTRKRFFLISCGTQTSIGKRNGAMTAEGDQKKQR